jgi:hypothetical protein
MPGPVRDRQRSSLHDRVKPRPVGHVVSAITLLCWQSQRRSDEGIFIMVTFRPQCLCYTQVFFTVLFSEKWPDVDRFVGIRKFSPVERRHFRLGWPTMSKGGCGGVPCGLRRVAKASSTMGAESYQDDLTVRVKTPTSDAWELRCSSESFRQLT